MIFHYIPIHPVAFVFYTGAVFIAGDVFKRWRMMRKLCPRCKTCGPCHEKVWK